MSKHSDLTDLSRFDRVPPQDINAEQAVLGSVLAPWADRKPEEVFLDAAEIIEDQSFFYKSVHRKIWATMEYMAKSNIPIDFITLNKALREFSILEEIGGAYYLTELTEKTPMATRAKVQDYARIVKDCYYRRFIIQKCDEISGHSYEEEVPTKDLVEMFSAIPASRSAEEHSDITMSTAIDSMLKEYDFLRNIDDPNYVVGVSLSLRGLDNVTTGARNDDFLVIGGRPSHGKTAILTQMIEKASVRNRMKIGFFSLEMSSTQIAMRIAAQRTQTDLFNLRRGKLTDNEFSQMARSLEELSTAPLIIDERPGLTLGQIILKARQWKMVHDIQLLAVDYLQLIRRPMRGTQAEEVGDIARGLRDLGKELNIPVIALSQLSRKNEDQNRFPQLADLRGGGGIEEAASMVLFVFRPYFNTDRKNPEMKYIIAKSRNGPLAVFTGKMDFSSTRLLSDEEEDF